MPHSGLCTCTLCLATQNKTTLHMFKRNADRTEEQISHCCEVIDGGRRHIDPPPPPQFACLCSRPAQRIYVQVYVHESISSSSSQKLAPQFTMRFWAKPSSRSLARSHTPLFPVSLVFLNQAASDAIQMQHLCMGLLCEKYVRKNEVRVGKKKRKTHINKTHTYCKKVTIFWLSFLTNQGP